MKLIDTPEFQDAIPFLEKGTYSHSRYELALDAPAAIRTAALKLRVPCARCGRRIQAFRPRKAPASRGHNVGRIYLAMTCELSHDVGCARSGKAREASAELARVIAARPASAQGRLI